MSVSGDPYYESKSVIESSLDELKAFQARWRQLLSSKSDSSKDEVVWIKNEMARVSRKIQLELTALERSFEIVEKNPSGFSHILPELPGRKKFVQEVRQNLSRQSNDMVKKEREIEMKTLRDKRSQLFGGGNELDQLDELRRQENEDLIEGEFSKQDQMEKKTLVGVQKISDRLDVVREKAVDMGDEVDHHAVLLNDLERNVEKADGILKRATRRMNQITRKKGVYVCIIVTIVVLIVILTALILVLVLT